MSARLYLVVPCYNEQEVLSYTASTLEGKLNALIQAQLISPESRIVFVDDGSKDDTWNIICKLHEDNDIFAGLKLSRNRGHQNALLAGLLEVKDRCDVTISMDADLQDDVDVIDSFIEKYYEGFEIIYGVRGDRKSDTTVKRGMAELFYNMMTNMGVETIFNHADCRLMSQRSLEALSEFKEVNLFLRGMVPLIGFKSCTVEYSRLPRYAGTSKYPFKKMLQLALNGITSFSVTPLRIVTVTGSIIFTLSVLSLVVLLVLALLRLDLTLSLAWVIASNWTVCGIMMTSLGVVGEYIGKIFEESKHRPRYIVDEFIIK
ncbi:MAG: glycosyltransferase family 2 protein [Oscillospiraceae bacterium]|nr:glycosyltransferase family 2 protein [Oscillospiraceae bacterium]